MVSVTILPPSNITLNNRANILYQNITSNGVVYAVNSVLLLPFISSAVLTSPSSNYTSFLILADAATFNATIDASQTTLLPPSEAAFATLPNYVQHYLLSIKGEADLRAILGLHIIPNKVLYSSLLPNTNQTTQSGATLQFSLNSSSNQVVINNVATIEQADVLTSNGVVQGIDRILYPSGFVFNLQKALIGLNASYTLEAFQNLNWIEILTGTPTFTILSPSNAAWERRGGVPSNTSTLQQLLPYHVLNGTYLTSTFLASPLVPTLLPGPFIGGRMLPIRVHSRKIANDTYEYFINDQQSQILTEQSGPGIAVANGVIHIIDQVLDQPLSLYEILNTTNITYSHWAETLEYIGYVKLDEILNTNSTTLFLPINSAWGMLPAGAAMYLSSTEQGILDLVEILSHHVIIGEVLYIESVSTTPTEYATLAGGAVTVQRVSANGVSTLVINQNASSVDEADIVYANGVGQPIDTVLVPSDVPFTAAKLLTGLGYSTYLEAVLAVGLWDLVATGAAPGYSFFAPNNTAWNLYTSDLNKLFKNKSKMQKLIKAHIVPQGLASLEIGEVYPTLAEGVSIRVVDLFHVEIMGGKGAASEILNWTPMTPSAGSNGYVYGLTSVLDVDIAGGGGKKGLPPGIIVLIVFLVMCATGVLVASAFVAYILYKKRTSYNPIN